ncbi:unnamed protein product, partial [Meganyctiphanes norvegica]
DYLAILVYHGYLDIQDLFAIIDYLLDHDLATSLLNLLASEPHFCRSSDPPNGVDGGDLPTLEDVLVNLVIVGELDQEELVILRGLIIGAGIPHVLSLQVMAKDDWYEMIIENYQSD